MTPLRAFFVYLLAAGSLLGARSAAVAGPHNRLHRGSQPKPMRPPLTC